MTVQNPPATRLSFTSLLWTIARFREAGISIFILILVIAVTLRSPTFLTADNFQDILLNISILAIVALAQTMVILTHGIDLSVSSMVGLVAMMVSFVVKQNQDISILLVVLLGMALGAVLGTFNGLIITYGKVPPIIATLGTLSIYRGLVFYYSQGTWINSFELPKSFKLLSKGTPLGLPNMVIIAILVAVIIYTFLNYTRTGRDIFAVAVTLTRPSLRGFEKNASYSWFICSAESPAVWPRCYGLRVSNLLRPTLLLDLNSRRLPPLWLAGSASVAEWGLSPAYYWVLCCWVLFKML